MADVHTILSDQYVRMFCIASFKSFSSSSLRFISRKACIMSRCISHGTPFAELSSESADKDCQKVESVCSTLEIRGGR